MAKRASLVTVDPFGRRWHPLSCGHNVNLDWLEAQVAVGRGAPELCSVCHQPFKLAKLARSSRPRDNDVSSLHRLQ